MRTTILTVFTGMLCLVSAGSFAQRYPFTINGKLENISPMPKKMYLFSIVDGLLKQSKDSTNVINGEYQFKGELNVDEAVIIKISPDAVLDSKNGLSVYLDKGELNVLSTGMINEIKVSGSASGAHQQSEVIKSGVEKEKEELKKIATSEAYQSSSAIQADVLKRSQDLGFKSIFDMYQFAKNNPDSRLSPFLTYALVSIGMISGAGQDTLMRLLPTHIKEDRLGKAIMQIPVTRDSLMQVELAKQKAIPGKIVIGSKAPDFTQKTPQGKAISLSSFKGKYILIDFWASWCVPCREENPNVVKAYHQYKDKGFTVLGVSLDSQSGKAAWLKAITNDGLTWTQVSDLKGWKNNAADLYGVKSVPQNFLIDPNGLVIGVNLRGSELQKKLASLF